MGARTMIPLIDLVFLTLGSVLGAMTQMERIEAIPVEVSQIQRGSGSVQRGDFEMLTVTRDGMTLNGKPITNSELPSMLAGKDVVLRAERSLPTEQTLLVLGLSVNAGANVSLEVKPPGSDSEPRAEGE